MRMRVIGIDEKSKVSSAHQPPFDGSIRLEISRGSAHNPVRQIDKPVFLMGTAYDCDLVLGDLQFPEVHAYLFATSQGVRLRHLGDGPIISVDGRVVRSADLRDGDRIRTGSYEFRVSIAGLPTLPRLRRSHRRDIGGPGETTSQAPAAIRELLEEVRGGRSVFERPPDQQELLSQLQATTRCVLYRPR